MRTGDVAGLERGPAVATVEVPAHVGQHGLGVLGDELGIDERWDHWTSRSASAAASAEHVAQRPAERGRRGCRIVVLDLHPAERDLGVASCDRR